MAGLFRQSPATIKPHLTLEPDAGPLYCLGRTGALAMLALYIIIGFVVVIGAVNAFEFGRVD